MGKFWKTTKGKITVIAGSVGVVAAVAAVALILLREPEGFRTIAVEEVHGTTVVANEKNESVDAYKGMHLESGDDVAVQAQSDMTILLDMDKYVYAEENSHFRIEASGNETQSRTVIRLEDGTVLNRIKNQLEEGSVYQVDTPNSTMAVRGTVFRVQVNYGEDGLAYTLVEVLEGSVQIDLKDLKGNYNGVTRTFGPGEAAKIRGGEDFSEFVVGPGGNEVLEIDYENMPDGTVYSLTAYMDDGEELCIGKDLLLDYAELEEHKPEKEMVRDATCEQEGEEVTVCSVCGEVMEKISIPKLVHTPSDTWMIVKEATCEEDGSQTRSCAVCGKILETQEIAALGHTMGNWVTVREAACEATGLRSRTCTICGITQTQEMAALGHQTDKWTVTKEADCTDSGNESLICTVCGKVLETKEIAATGHDMRWTTTKQPTCTEKGIESGSCSDCGATETREIAATGHQMGAWTVTPATCTATGSRVRSCAICQQQESKEIAMLAHSYELTHLVRTPSFNDPIAEVETDAEVTGSCSECQTLFPGTETGSVMHTVKVTQESFYKYQGYCVDCGADVVITY